jgi:hypothetical protein
MATGSQCGQTCIQSVSHFSRAATEQAAASPCLTGARGTVQTRPLPRSVPDPPDSTWKQTYPGRDEQVRHVRAALRPLPGDCPIADDVVLVMSELSSPGLESVSPKANPRSLSYLPAGSSCRQRRASSLLLHGLKASRDEQQSARGRGGHIQAARRQQ